MTVNLTKRSVQELEALIQNHRDKKATDRPLYIEAMAELERRKGKGLDFAKTKEVVAKAAREHRFLSYKDLADASGAEWTQVHYAIGGHLYRLVEFAHRQGWPMLSAIVVNKPNVETGKMEPETLKGFIEAAHLLGHTVTDEEAFLRAQQEAVFEWASRLPGDDGT